ncbi:MAG TPA: HTTM domain-containing protein [Flavobacterium sp.]|nr:HTTM domain-containing protein [Flavobacterium sp.]
MTPRLFRKVDNAPLILFRIFLGALLAIECFGAIATGWVRANSIDPKFTFSYIGLEWLQPLPGYGMYAYFAIMGLLALLVMLGYRYRWSLGFLTLLWTGAYLMQKSSYNNHYYLLLLICVMLWFLPAADDVSLDARRRKRRSRQMPQWCAWVLMFQIAVVYFFAAVSKVYTGWLDGSFLRIALQPVSERMQLSWLVSNWFTMVLAWGGLFFDALVIPLFLWRRPRTLALVASLIFHCFNAIFLQIGIFPFFALSFVVFFYPPEQIRKVFFRRESTLPVVEPGDARHILYGFFVPFLLVQLALPLRHWFIEGDVIWTEEGHRLSWRMMLRERTGYLQFHVWHNGTELPYDYRTDLTPKQQLFVATKPDGTWQMAQYIHTIFEQRGFDVQVFADCRVSINGAPEAVLIDPTVDLAHTPWEHFRHNPWITPFPIRP